VALKKTRKWVTPNFLRVYPSKILVKTKEDAIQEYQAREDFDKDTSFPFRDPFIKKYPYGETE
jgi:hypothetical protein